MPDRKRLLVLTSSYPSDTADGRAAAGFFVRDFVNKLSALCNITVLTQHTGEGRNEIQKEQYLVVRFPWLGKEQPLSNLRFPQDIVSIMSIMSAGTIASIQQIRGGKPDHIIALWAIPCGIWALIIKKIYGIPYSIWCLGADVWNYQNSRIARAILKTVLKNANNVYADGFELSDAVNDIAQVGCTYLPSSRYFTIPVHKYALKPEGVRHYLFVGRYHPNKGPDLLIQAIRLLSQEIRSRIHCHFYGGGPLADELEQLISSLGLGDTITLGGFIGEKKLSEVLYATDVIVIPSRKDTISLMVSAALQMNKAIIAADVGDMGYILKKHKIGCVVSANSPESLAEGIQHDLSFPENCSAGRSSLKEVLDISSAVSNILEGITVEKTVLT